MAAPYRSDRKCRIGREVEMMIVYILFLLLVNQAHSYTRSGAVVIVKRNSTARLTFQVDSDGTTKYFIDHYNEQIFRRGHCLSNCRLLNTTDRRLSLEISRRKTNKAGLYVLSGCLSTNCTKQITLAVVDKPQVNLTVPTTSPILQVTSNNILQGGVTLYCSARSTSKPDDHNLTMVYGWFIDGVFTRSTSPTLHIELTEGQREVTCVATDYPDCGELLNNTSRTTDIKKVKENVRCENVLGESSPLKIIPEYGPYQINLRPSRSEIKKKLSEILQVKCDVKCNPPCKVGWLRDEGDVDDDEDDDESILYIDKVEEDDVGEYTCTATNIHGDLNSSFTLWLTGDSVNMHFILPVGILIIIMILVITAFTIGRLHKSLKKRKRRREEACVIYEDIH